MKTINEILATYTSLDDLLDNASPDEIDIYIDSIRPPSFDENFRDEKHW